MIDPTFSTLAGVGMGSAATYLIDRGRDSRRDRREAQAAQRADERSRIRGVRLVLMDLFTAIGHMKSTYETKAWPLVLRLPEAAWNQERSQLSEILTDEQWRDVATAFMNISVWNELTGGLYKSDLLSRFVPRTKLPEGDEKGLSVLRDTLIQTCAEAATAIRPIALPSTDEDDPLARFFREMKELGEAGP